MTRAPGGFALLEELVHLPGSCAQKAPSHPCPKRVVHSHVLSHSGYLQGWSLLNLPGQPAPVVNRLAVKKCFLKLSGISLLFYFNLCLLSCPWAEKSLAPSSVLPTTGIRTHRWDAPSLLLRAAPSLLLPVGCCQPWVPLRPRSAAVLGQVARLGQAVGSALADTAGQAVEAG